MESTRVSLWCSVCRHTLCWTTLRTIDNASWLLSLQYVLHSPSWSWMLEKKMLCFFSRLIQSWGKIFFASDLVCNLGFLHWLQWIRLGKRQKNGSEFPEVAHLAHCRPYSLRLCFGRSGDSWKPSCLAAEVLIGLDQSHGSHMPQP